MANTGRVITITLKEMELPANTPTGNTKMNVPEDPDYIGPVLDTLTCPLSFTTTCPVIIATGEMNSILFEFSLPNAVVNNPSIATVRVKALQGVTLTGLVDFILPKANPNYFSGEITGLTFAVTYTITIEYLNSSAVVIQSCPALATITTNSTNPS